MTLCLRTRWFRFFVGHANWLQGEPFGIRFMWLPHAVAPKFADLPCAYDAWVTRYGFVVNQRSYMPA